MSLTQEESQIPLTVAAGAAIVQAVRAMITGLIPLTLIALFAWASAGSGSGNTGDALRGASLLWLATHHVAMDLTFAATQTTGLFSLLPIGLLIVPVLTLRGAGLRLAREVHGARLETLLLSALTLAFTYGVLVTSVAFMADTPAVRPRFLEAFGYGFVVATLAGGSRLLRISWPARWKPVLRFLRWALVGLFIPATALVITSLVVNFDEVLNILSVLRLGVVSTLFVLLISLLYLPNLAVWALAYAVGIGFGFGSGTLLSPWESTIGAVPAFPLFAALPAEPPSWAPMLPVVVAGVLLVAVWASHRSSREFLSDGLRLTGTVLVLGVVLAWFSGGSLIGGALSAVGPSLWKFPVVVAAGVSVAYLVIAGPGALLRRWRS